MGFPLGENATHWELGTAGRTASGTESSLESQMRWAPGERKDPMRERRLARHHNIRLMLSTTHKPLAQGKQLCNDRV